MVHREQAFPEHRKVGSYELFRQAILGGERPLIVATCPASLASLMAQCWAHDLEDRPEMLHVVQALEQILEEVEQSERAAVLERYIADSSARTFWSEHFFQEVHT